MIEPSGDTYELPVLADAGVRYVLSDPAESRTSTVFTSDTIEFWCDASAIDVDIVIPSAFEYLMWDVCAVGGYCGGVVDGEDLWAYDFFPKTGLIDAEIFATCVLRAEGGFGSSDSELRARRWLEAEFRRRLGDVPVPVSVMQPSRRPFD